MTSPLDGSPFEGAPFDGTAATYDRTFTDTELGRWLRASVWRHLDRAFGPGDRVLELGCGTGEDAVHLAARGVHVVATDASDAMLAATEAKVRARGVEDLVTLSRLRLGDTEPDLPSSGAPDGLFDGACSNFGALNCIADRRPLVRALAARLRPGAPIVFVLMGPFCPWEIVAFLLHGRIRDAFRRFRSGRPARVGEASLPVWYPSPRRLRRELTAGFHRFTVRGIGTVLPPTDLARLADRWPRAFRALRTIDRSAGAVFPGTWLNDHYLVRGELRSTKKPL